MKNKVSFVVVALLLLMAIPALALDLDFSGADSVGIDTGNNPLNVRTVENGFAVTARAECGLKFESSVKDGRLHLEKSGADQNCVVELLIPANLGSVVLESGNGNISFQGDAAELGIDSGNGAIGVNASRMRRARLNSSNGNITVSSCRASLFGLSSSNGRISLLRSSGRVQLQGSNSLISLSQVVIPASSSNSIQTSNGKVNVSRLLPAKLKGGNRAGRIITTRTINGTVTVNGRIAPDSTTLVTSGRKAARMRIKTTNADIAISN